ncbi:T-complex protein 11-like protein 1 [Homalodisca vitripennis]|uniref:T-complex protein 11-like protein 1 n=1 Tax=Homalodisca vitripennis TaxID=197043 RepID=UPI001EEC1BEA|nr:T-complex protein 11-like protein 1 [Homalodisca vitripennis]XP_046665394.1 T-complex protein 11-like protein 1 [Homalodisca vitripennis]XP_046665395.1 T-complex protein 11-like protein 1 [Homalodisca vitripennis]XP_046665396.1 T-complex protein 11-like protein 1 [Homalodisca vitripennis]
MSSDEIPSGSRTHNDDEAPSTSNQGRGRNLSESSDQGSKRQRTLSESFFPGLTNASPPKFVSLEEIISAAKGMANMALAHEIAVDSNFELEKREPPENSLHRRVKETMLKAFWDILSQQLQEDPPNYTQGLVLLSEIKETLLTLLLPHNTKLKEEIEEVLDIELIRQQVENGSLDFPYYANYVTSVMAKLCTPARDDCIRKLKQETDTVSVFKGILETLELMRIDMANFTIEMYRPLLVASSVDYEKSKFKEYIKVNPDGLEVTKQWLFRHVSPSTSLASADDWREVIAQAYLELLTWDDSNAFPETLVMDRSRLVELRNEVLRVTVAATVLLLVVSSVPQLQSNAAFKVSLKNHMLLLLQDCHTDKDVEGVLANVSAQAVQDCNAALPEPLTPEHRTTVESQVMQVMADNHKIRLLVFQRIKEFLHLMITSTVPSQLQVPAGLSTFTKELSGLAARYHRLVSHNRSVFGEYYTDILSTFQVPNGV